MHLLTQSALLKALGWSLFNSLWQMSLLWVCYHLFVLIFRDASARTRHGLAVILLASGAAWTALTFVTTYWFAPETGAWILTAPWQAYGSRLLSTSRSLVEGALSWCSFLYLLILAGLAIRYAGDYLRSRRLTRSGLSKMAPEFRIFVTTTARNMGIARHVKVYLSSLVGVPMTLGCLKPVILLPLALTTHLSPQQVEAVLVHELAHIRRKDYLINLGVTAMELLYFFNPFTRLLIAQLKKEREHCCDDLVLQFQYDRRAYVSALLSLAQDHRQIVLTIAATGAGGNRLLLQRAKRILHQERKSEPPRARSLFLLFLTTGMALLAPALSHRALRPATDLAANAKRQPAVTAAAYPTAEGFGKPIINSVTRSRPPGTKMAAPTAATTHASHKAALHRTDAGNTATVQNETFLFRTAAPMTIADPAFADVVILDNRDFSIADPSSAPKPTPAPPSATESYPFVPQSSFSFHYTDTLPPEDRLALLTLATEKSIRDQIVQLERQLKVRLYLLRKERSALTQLSSAGTGNPAASDQGARSTSEKRLKQLFHEQLQLEQQYLMQMDSLQRQLQRAARRLTTVYI
ncbi:MAG TPA: M56 family metallopeptidase [Puia sp.]|nr:M56 family metallopeptidase [Puia sp.]